MATVKAIACAMLLVAAGIAGGCTSDPNESAESNSNRSGTSSATSSDPDVSSSVGGVAPTSPSTDRSDTSNESLEPFGDAQIVPSEVRGGETFQVQPSGVIQPFCLNYAELHIRTGNGDFMSFAQLGDGVFVERSMTVPTWPPCQPPRSSDPISYAVPVELAAGHYIVCVTPELTAAGCGELTVHSDTDR